MEKRRQTTIVHDMYVNEGRCRRHTRSLFIFKYVYIFIYIYWFRYIYIYCIYIYVNFVRSTQLLLYMEKTTFLAGFHVWRYWCHWHSTPKMGWITLPETSIFASENGCLKDDPFPLGSLFWGAPVSGSISWIHINPPDVTPKRFGSS